MKRKLVLIIIAVLVVFPKINFGQAPTLGTTADFVLFTSVGAVSNTGITHLTGNVGTNSGLSTGFGNVDGVMHDGDGVSATCAADLTIAYNQLNAAIPTFFPAPLLGGGATLVPGVYYISSPATLDLSLTLDGLGDPTSVFIFQIDGAFSTNANSKVKLINGALACNVFWKVEGLVSMGPATLMRGTIVANNAAINMSTNDTLEGRALSTAGAITVDGTLAYTPIGCGSPYLTGPIAPTLATVDCYAIFSAIGPVTNVGVTYVTGDVGSDNGLTTGYNPLFVTGAIHPVPDGSTAACATDLINVYNYLNALPSDIELLYPAQFGNNLVLTPHTYIMNAAATFTDSLYLNAQGNSNAVFVIQINGALSTSTYSKVILINGAQSSNVYWMVEGAVSINDYSIFNGTIICNNGAINLAIGVSMNGRILTTTGAVTTSADSVTIPVGSCGTGMAPLITTEPINQTACIGSSVSFSVIATGTGLTYQWRKGLINLIDGGNISGATTATLTINPVSGLDAATNYNVIVSGTVPPNDTSINVSLTVSAGTIITSEPMNQIACPGDSISFSVAATGSTLTYQWRKGIVNLIDGGSISGSTTSVLTINPVNITDAALDYNVIVSGGCLPNDTSINASLIIGTTPMITSEPTNQTACSGDSVSFSVIATALTYQWRKGSVNLIDGGSISGSTTSTLTINPVNISDAALNYNVVITGACSPNDTSINVSLTVTPTPVASANSNSPVCTGNSINLTATTVTGGTYSWTSSTGYTSSSQNPIILSSTLADAGTYSLTVTANGCTSNTSSVIVIVNDCPADLSIIKTVNDSTPFIGKEVVFTIVVTNNGPGDATGVEVTDILQSGYEYISSSATTGTFNSTTGVWLIGTMLNGTTETLTITVKVLEGGNYENTAIVYANEIDANMADNNSSTETFPTDFFIPEGFSPNGDGINDLFVIRGINNYPKNNFTIFNRWGNKVFEASPYKNTWDGRSTTGLRVGGNELPVATYFYILDLGDGSEIIKGTIYLNK